MKNGFGHTPVLLERVIELLAPERTGVFVDGTLGGGGHAQAVLERLGSGSMLIGIDRDPAAIAAASERLKAFGDRFVAVRGNFFDCRSIVSSMGIPSVNGILFDLGVSSYQLDTPQRGFSYHEEAPLDMRMDPDASLDAYGVVNNYTHDALVRVIREYGEERFASRIASRIIRQREKAPISTTIELAALIKEAIPAANRREGPHPARRTFQALRIEVNGELAGLEAAIREAHDLLAPGGRLAMITFHSLEDRIVKQTFRNFESPCICDPRAPMCTCGRQSTAMVLTKKPIVADERELEENQRARSAKLRAIEKR